MKRMRETLVLTPKSVSNSLQEFRKWWAGKNRRRLCCSFAHLSQFFQQCMSSNWGMIYIGKVTQIAGSTYHQYYSLQRSKRCDLFDHIPSLAIKRNLQRVGHASRANILMPDSFFWEPKSQQDMSVKFHKYPIYVLRTSPTGWQWKGSQDLILRPRAQKNPPVTDQNVHRRYRELDRVQWNLSDSGRNSWISQSVLTKNNFIILTARIRDSS